MPTNIASEIVVGTKVSDANISIVAVQSLIIPSYTSSFCNSIRTTMCTAPTLNFFIIFWSRPYLVVGCNSIGGV